MYEIIINSKLYTILSIIIIGILTFIVATILDILLDKNKIRLDTNRNIIIVLIIILFIILTIIF